MNERGAILTRILDDGRAIDLWKQIYTYKLTLSRSVDDLCWFEGWEFQNFAAAAIAVYTWNPDETSEPVGWYRHWETGRRRPDGDPTKEYIQF